jgi:hypothetical protein
MSTAYVHFSFLALCAKNARKEQQHHEKYASKIDFPTSKNTNHLWDETNSAYTAGYTEEY